MKRITVTLLLLVLFGCAETVDIAKLTAEGHFEYAKKLYDEQDFYEARNQFKSILLQNPGNAIIDDAQFYLGMTYFKRREFILAAYEFSKLIRDIPASKFVPEAQFMLAESYYQLSPPAPLEQGYTKKAIEEFQAFLDFFPTNEKCSEAEKKIKELTLKLAEKEFNAGVIYEKMEYYTAALKSFKYVVNHYHDTRFAPEAMFKRINILLNKERFDEAKREYLLLASRYPNFDKLEKVKLIVENISTEK